jgi:N-acetylglutamate synthase-like GNAT family acetyltransferase
MSAHEISFRTYRRADYQACIDIFDANCPEFFAPNERQEYRTFLGDLIEGYEVCEVNGQAAGAFGLFDASERVKSLNWILLDPHKQGIGVGSKIMDRVVDVGRASGSRIVRISASHKSAPFFERFGAEPTSVTEDGWGPGMHRVQMELQL